MDSTGTEVAPISTFDIAQGASERGARFAPTPPFSEILAWRALEQTLPFKRALRTSSFIASNAESMRWQKSFVSQVPWLRESVRRAKRTKDNSTFEPVLRPI